jgi:hypothetical protein
MTHIKALEQWETKVGNCVVTPQALWAVAKSFMKSDGPNAPTSVHGSLGITYHTNEKANGIADCLENQFTSHDLCYKNHEWQMETRVQALLTSVDDTLLGKVRPCNIHKLVHWERLVDLMVFRTNALDIFQEDHWYIWHIYLITASGCPIFWSLGRKQKL